MAEKFYDVFSSGQKFAMHEMKTVLAWALRKFSFHTHHNLLDQGEFAYLSISYEACIPK